MVLVKKFKLLQNVCTKQFFITLKFNLSEGAKCYSDFLVLLFVFKQYTSHFKDSYVEEALCGSDALPSEPPGFNI